MGNCLRHQLSMESASDDRGAAVSEKAMKMEEEGLLQLVGGGKIGFCKSSSSSSSSTTEIKIKITKKQLEELLGNKADVKELSVQQVLALLMKNVGSTDRYHLETHQRSWQPALQSIPELN